MLGDPVGAEDFAAYNLGVSDAISLPSPPRGPVPTMISFATRSGRLHVISSATMPPIEKPSTSTRFRVPAP